MTVIDVSLRVTLFLIRSGLTGANFVPLFSLPVFTVSIPSSPLIRVSSSSTLAFRMNAADP